MLKRGLALLGRQRDFRLLMAVQFAAQAGDGFFQTAVAKAVAFGGQEGFDPESASSVDELLTIVLFLFIPYSIISPFLGVVIDRWDRRRLLFATNALRGALVLLIGLFGVTTTADEPVTGVISREALPSLFLFLTFMLTLAGTRIVLATKAAALPVTLEGRSLLEGNAVSQLGGALFQLGAAGIAFIASTALPAGPLVLVGGLVYGASAVAALRLGRTEELHERSTFGQEVARVARNIVAGIREVARTAKAGAAITTYFWLRLLWSFSIVAISFIARELLGDDDLKIVVITGGAGASGAALGFLLAGRVTARVRTTGHVVLASSSVAGIAVTVLGPVEARASIAVLAFFLGFGFFLGKISLDTMVQEALGDDFRGRAFSLYDIAYNIAWVAAAAVMQVWWTDELQGVLMAGMGVAFLIGLAFLGAWYRRAGLLAVTSG